MNKIIMTTPLLYTGLIIAGCEKTYSVEEFKKVKDYSKNGQLSADLLVNLKIVKTPG